MDNCVLCGKKALYFTGKPGKWQTYCGDHKQEAKAASQMFMKEIDKRFWGPCDGAAKRRDKNSRRKARTRGAAKYSKTTIGLRQGR